MGRRKGGCYAFRCNKPGAYFGWPVVGRHWAYVGETTSYYHRRQQHVLGDSHWGAAPKAWADLKPRFYRLPTVLWQFKSARLVQETVYVWLLCPVYNVKQQPPYNMRRISSTKARQQRWARQQFGPVYAAVRSAARGVVLLALVAVLGWSGWEYLT